MRFLWLLPAWLLINLGLIGPQAALAWTHSIVVAVIMGLLAMGALLGMFIRIAPTRNSAFVGVGIIAGIVALTHGIGTKDIQLAASVQQGRSLEGVTMADALAHGEEGTWVRITDARVRSEDAHTLYFVSGTENSETHTHVSVAPVTLATEVTNEMVPLRVHARGPKMLWACSESEGDIRSWDGEHQAVRGRLGVMKKELADALAKELPAMLSVAPKARCVELDHALDAKSAGSQIATTALAFFLMIPLFGLGVLAFAKTKRDDES